MKPASERGTAVNKKARSQPFVVSKKHENGGWLQLRLSAFTYHLVDSADLGLENRDGVSDRRLGSALVVGDG